jgi:hypothetical protein
VGNAIVAVQPPEPDGRRRRRAEVVSQYRQRDARRPHAVTGGRVVVIAGIRGHQPGVCRWTLRCAGPPASRSPVTERAGRLRPASDRAARVPAGMVGFEPAPRCSWWRWSPPSDAGPSQAPRPRLRTGAGLCCRWAPPRAQWPGPAGWRGPPVPCQHPSWRCRCPGCSRGGIWSPEGAARMRSRLRPARETAVELRIIGVEGQDVCHRPGRRVATGLRLATGYSPSRSRAAVAPGHPAWGPYTKAPR